MRRGKNTLKKKERCARKRKREKKSNPTDNTTRARKILDQQRGVPRRRNEGAASSTNEEWDVDDTRELAVHERRTMERPDGGGAEVANSEMETLNEEMEEMIR